MNNNNQTVYVVFEKFGRLAAGRRTDGHLHLLKTSDWFMEDGSMTRYCFSFLDDQDRSGKGYIDMKTKSGWIKHN